jgi:hypothetical protein
MNFLTKLMRRNLVLFLVIKKVVKVMKLLERIMYYYLMVEHKLLNTKPMKKDTNLKLHTLTQ